MTCECKKDPYQTELTDSTFSARLVRRHLQ